MPKPITVAVVDSGINPTHSHVGEVRGGVALLNNSAELEPAWLDELGHGTAVAAAIRGHAPDVELFAVRVFEQSFATRIEWVVAGLEWCVENQMDVVNLSLATLKDLHRETLDGVCRRIPILVAPYDFLGVPAFPGSFPSAFGVAGDQMLERDAHRFEGTPTPHFVASPYPRSLEAVPDARNFSGPSFATANLAGLICRMMIERGTRDPALLRSLLCDAR
jgi:hypothetical protein